MTISMEYRTRQLPLSLILLLPVIISNVNADSASDAIDRLRPIDTSSPRALTDSLRHETKVLLDFYTQNDHPAIRRQAQRVIRIFDFSDTPPALLSQKGPEHFWQLVDIMGRLPEMDLEEISDAEQDY